MIVLHIHVHLFLELMNYFCETDTRTRNLILLVHMIRKQCLLLLDCSSHYSLISNVGPTDARTRNAISFENVGETLVFNC